MFKLKFQKHLIADAAMCEELQSHDSVHIFVMDDGWMDDDGKRDPYVSPTFFKGETKWEMGGGLVWGTGIASSSSVLH